jgi:integrase
VVSDVLGHANIQQTANTYQHADPGVTADWMQRFEQALSTAPREPAGAPN